MGFRQTFQCLDILKRAFTCMYSPPALSWWFKYPVVSVLSYPYYSCMQKFRHQLYARVVQLYANVYFTLNHDDFNIKTPMSSNEIKACRLVRRCIDGNVCSNFVNDFVKRDHVVATRNNGYQLELPNVRLEYSI